MGSEPDKDLALIGHKLDQVLSSQEVIKGDVRALNAAHAATREELAALPMAVMELSDNRFARKETVQTINRTFLAILIAVVMGASGLIYDKLITPSDLAAAPQATVVKTITPRNDIQQLFSEPLARAREYAPAQVQ
jgi:hypothetical protein